MLEGFFVLQYTSLRPLLPLPSCPRAQQPPPRRGCLGAFVFSRCRWASAVESAPLAFSALSCVSAVERTTAGLVEAPPRPVHPLPQFFTGSERPRSYSPKRVGQS